MDPLTIIVSAVVAGAAAAATDVVSDAIKDGYAGLKALIQRKYQDKEDVRDALEGVEKKPESGGRQQTLKEELEAVEVHQDSEVLEEAQKLLDLLKEHGVETGITYQAEVHGSGAIAQDHSVAAGEGGIAVRGDVKGGIILGSDKKKKR